jgi:hypothetical protein
LNHEEEEGHEGHEESHSLKRRAAAHSTSWGFAAFGAPASGTPFVPFVSFAPFVVDRKAMTGAEAAEEERA